MLLRELLVTFKLNEIELLKENELKGIEGGYYYTTEEVSSMEPHGSKNAENIGYSVGRALAFIGVVLLTKKF